MIIVFTGNGKGKTTAALGSAMRALGQGKRVIVIQFIKGPWKSGEDYFIKRFKIPDLRFKIIKGGKGFVGILGDPYSRKVHIEVAKKTLELAEKAIKSTPPAGGWDLIILDEINVAVDLGLIKAADVLKILKNLPEEKIVILTGRGASKAFIKKADLVTEMKEIKHPFRVKRQAQIALEF
jgi:cob(I)alamin adenosyltransferase